MHLCGEELLLMATMGAFCLRCARYFYTWGKAVVYKQSSVHEGYFNADGSAPYAEGGEGG